MLTKDLLEYRIRQGRASPAFVDVDAAPLLSLASELIALVEASQGAVRGETEARLAARAGAFERPKIAQGLVKLLVDRIRFEEPSEEARSLRRDTLDLGARLLRSLPDDASLEDWESLLQREMLDLEHRRATLYADHPNERRMLDWRPLDARRLLERYNLALVQGLVMRARTLTIRAFSPALTEVRTVLRWLKFCRLVAEITPDKNDWTLSAEGPAEILSMSRKYGLQLAVFVEVLPVFSRFTISAELDFGRGKPVRLELDEKAPLAAPSRPLGHVPEELGVIVSRLEDAQWGVELTPTPRLIGLGGACVPDLTLVHKNSGVERWVEFFHRWHRHSLDRRLAELELRPEPRLLIAVDEALLGDEDLSARVRAHPQAMTFKGFPSERKLKSLLARSLEG